LKQLVRYAVVGIATNLAGYAVYLLVTWAGVEPKLAMSCLYAIGATVSFLGNRTWTFGHRGNVAGAAARFAIAHLLGYLLNLALLVVFVDRLGFPHQLVQAVAVVVVALFLFVLFRVFVFPGGRQPARP
jgi:putative flippase GtrA